MMNQKEKMIENLLSEIDGYFMNLVYLKDLIKVEEHITSSQMVSDVAPNFSLIVQCALIDSYNLCLMKLYDKSDEAKTIPNLIEKCKKNIRLFPVPTDALKELEDFEHELNNDEYLVQAVQVLRQRRDKFHAHNDKKYFGAKLANDTSYLPMYEIWFLTNFTEKVLSYLWEQLSDKKHREIKYNNDLDNLLHMK